MSSPEGGTDAYRMMLRMIVGPALRNQERVRGCLTQVIVGGYGVPP